MSPVPLPCPLTVAQIHDRPGLQEREVLTPPYQLARTSVYQNDSTRRVAWIEITGDDAWGAPLSGPTADNRHKYGLCACHTENGLPMLPGQY